MKPMLTKRPWWFGLLRWLTKRHTVDGFKFRLNDGSWVVYAERVVYAEHWYGDYEGGVVECRLYTSKGPDGTVHHPSRRDIALWREKRP